MKHLKIHADRFEINVNYIRNKTVGLFNWLVMTSLLDSVQPF